MARRSQRLSNTGIATPKHKRVASGSSMAISANKRSKKQQTTSTESQYFSKQSKPNARDMEEDDDDQENEESPGKDTETASEFDDGDEDSTMSEQEASETDEDEDGESRNGLSKKRSTPKGKISDVWRPGVKAGLGPGNQIIIKKPKARPAGKTPYADDTIHPNTLLFLEDLKENNDRQWLKMHEAEFRQSEKDWHSFVEKLTEKLIEIDDTVPELPVKDVIFRIYRDVRFSKDLTPYKPWFSAAWSRTGRKSSYAHYYVQIAPNKSFVGGGLWHPEAAPTSAMRTAIDQNAERFKGILINKDIRKEFLGGAREDPKAVVKAFVNSNSENALKTRPKGVSADHPEIDLLRLRNYTLGHKLTDEEVIGQVGMKRITHLLACLKPFITYCNQIVMPDEEDDASEEDDGEEGSEDEDGND